MTKYIFILFALTPIIAGAQKKYITPSYEESYGAPIKVYKGDTLVAMCDGYFINVKRAEFYDMAHKAILADSSFEDISLLLVDLNSFLERQEAMYNDINYNIDLLKATVSEQPKTVYKYIEIPKVVQVPTPKKPSPWPLIVGALAVGFAVGLSL